MLPALVLTAGLGLRLDPLTRLVAKPAVPLGDRALIEHVLAWLRAEQVADLVLNLHHRPETITRIVGDGAHLGLRVRYSWEHPILGSAGGPRRAQPLLDGNPFLIVNGDTLCRIALAPMIAAHTRSGASVTMAVVPNSAPERYNSILLDEDDAVRAFVPKGTPGPAPDAPMWHFIGVQVANANAFARLADGRPAETTSDLYIRMLAEQPGCVRAWRVHDTFVDVGTPRDYLRAVAWISGARVEHQSSVARSVVWPDVQMAPDVELDECIVAGPMALPRNFRAERSVIVPASVLRPGEAVPTVGDAAIFPL